MERTTHDRRSVVIVVICCIIAGSVGLGVSNPWVMIAQGCALIAAATWFGLPLWRREKRTLVVSIVVALGVTATSIAVLVR